MKKLIAGLCILIVTGFGMGTAQAAVGKCTVVKVDGEKMVIECNKQTKGFSEGNRIKIKSDRKGRPQNK